MTETVPFGQLSQHLADVGLELTAEAFDAHPAPAALKALLRSAATTVHTLDLELRERAAESVRRTKELCRHGAAGWHRDDVDALHEANRRVERLSNELLVAMDALRVAADAWDALSIASRNSTPSSGPLEMFGPRVRQLLDRETELAATPIGGFADWSSARIVLDRQWAELYADAVDAVDPDTLAGHAVRSVHEENRRRAARG